MLFEMSFSLPSFAKINWTLRVLGKREDGFHELCTIFQTVSLHDTLHFEAADDVSMTCDDPAVDVDETNLVMRAALALQSRYAVEKGARMHLAKSIPFPGGLGGGSSNAAIALIALSRLWNLQEVDLHAISEELGSDVPFFLRGGTALGTGRGEKIEQVADIEEQNVLIVTPEIGVSTADIFDSVNAPSLTNTAPDTNLTVCRKDADRFDLSHSELKNDLESTVFAQYPEVERVKNTLLELRAVKAAMSGSGASVFGIFDKQETRQAALNALATTRSWRKFAVSTVSRSKYREALGMA
jgi:4-diphosphocytidyl-2-C-methyl-D-erythritol kinase